MDFSLNQHTIIGRVGSPPAYAETKEGIPYTTLQVATHGIYSDRNGNVTSYSQWHHVAMHGALTEIPNKLNISTGDTVYITGESRTKKYECKKDNCTKHITELIAHKISIVSKNE